MKLFIFSALLIFVQSVFAQTSMEFSVLVKAQVSSNPASITLSWTNDAAAQGYIIYRKSVTDKAWGSPVATLPGTTNQYVDNTVQKNTLYEYSIQKNRPTFSAYGYICSGISLDANANRGKILLLIDESYSAPLSNEINELKNDLRADGWIVESRTAADSLKATQVKQIIKTARESDSRLKSIYILGHVAIPYSGWVAPDGHVGDHEGAWPADVYYAVNDESMWTDFNVSTVVASRAENRNIPGDGKFDQDSLNKKDADLELGRVDLINMPLLGNDTSLMRNYLQKAHAYKTREFDVPRRGLIRDEFGGFSGEAFARSGWRNFSVLCDSIDVAASNNYFNAVKSTQYLWSYGCGAGSYSSMAGTGSTSQFNSDSVYSVFNMFFGSYFGDWDSQNNFLRAPLGSRPWGLTSVWSGRPVWSFHHMGMGNTIGYSTRITQSTTYNNPYSSNYFPGFNHVALMGDPSLRLYMIDPPKSLNISLSNNDSTVNLSWTKSSDSILNYHIYRTRSLDKEWELITEVPSANSNYIDSKPSNGKNYYSVRAAKLEQSPSGTFYNLSLGLIDSATAKGSTLSFEAIAKNGSFEIYPNPSNGNISVKLNSEIPFTTSLIIYDNLGRIVFEKQIISNETIKINPDLNTGIYFINAGAISSKLIILK